MTPTMNLRFVLREESFFTGLIGGPPASRTVKVLQQFFAHEPDVDPRETYMKCSFEAKFNTFGLWQDVPVESE